MTKRSTLLKVVSIIMIIFAAIALILGLLSIAGANMLGAASAELGAEIAAIGGLLFAAAIFGTINAAIQLVFGILGLTLKNKKTLIILGCILIILAVITLIMNIANGSFSAMNLISLVLPILYFLGARQCEE